MTCVGETLQPPGKRHITRRNCHWWNLVVAHGLSLPKKRQEWSQGAVPLMPPIRLRGWHVLVCLS